jgi:parallel beta-helix repeat protein
VSCRRGEKGSLRNLFPLLVGEGRKSLRDSKGRKFGLGTTNIKKGVVMDQKKTGTIRGMVFSAAFFCLLPSLAAAQVPPGRPFQDLLDLINNLQNSVNNLQNRVTALERVEPQTFALDCATQTIKDSLDFLKPGDTLLVGGTCNENVVIPEEVHRMTLDGQGSAAINGPDSTRTTVEVRGNGVTIKNFAAITGGENGIFVTRGGKATIDGNTIRSTSSNGILVSQNSSARIINNTIQNNPQSGILVTESSSARIGILSTEDTVASPNIVQSNGDVGIIVSRSSNARIVGNTINNNGAAGVEVNRASQADITSNSIQNNAEIGILVNENSSARIGILSGEDTVPSPNTIQNNGEGGINVTRSSQARIVGNTISNNTDNGILVNRGSHADIASNIINANTGDGIFVTRNSGANLGEDAGTGIFDSPNTTAVNNGGFGIRCRTNSSVDGRTGSLTGGLGATSIRTGDATVDGDCVNSVIVGF